jgi:hypothetical protein
MGQPDLISLLDTEQAFAERAAAFARALEAARVWPLVFGLSICAISRLDRSSSIGRPRKMMLSLSRRE